jgi:transcriptional regulator with XRE-family HTH domain
MPSKKITHATFGDRLRGWRIFRKFTQHDAAGALGVPVSTFRKWEYGLNQARNDIIAGVVERLLEDGF